MTTRESSSRPSTVVALIATLALAASSLAGCASSSGTAPASGQGTSTKAKPVIHLDTDHATYPTLQDLADGSDLVAVGTLVSTAVDPGTSPGNDEDGAPLPPLPHTLYTIHLDTVYVGDEAEGSQVVVSVVGAETPDAVLVLDDGVPVTGGTPYLFFLRKTGGKYYPLAGNAIAPKQAGKFTMSTATTGVAPQDVTIADLEGLDGGGGGGGGGTATTPTILAPRIVDGVSLVKVYGKAQPGVEVRLGSRRSTSGAFKARKVTTTNAQGDYEFVLRIYRRLFWQVTAPDAAPSQVISTKVRIGVDLTATRVGRGRAMVRVVLSPRLRGHVVKLTLGNRGRKLAKLRTNRRGEAVRIIRRLPRKTVRIVAVAPRASRLMRGSSETSVDVR